jgi:hypothetical protein
MTDVDETAEALAARWTHEAEQHDRQADQTPDRFQAAAFRGLAEDLRARARQTLSETMAGRRLAAEEAERARLLADAEAAHRDTVDRYRRLAAEVPELMEDAARETLAIAWRIRAHAVELKAAQDIAAGSIHAVNTFGGSAVTTDYYEPMMRELMLDGAGPARLWNAARKSAIAAAGGLGARAAEILALEGPAEAQGKV